MSLGDSTHPSKESTILRSLFKSHVSMLCGSDGCNKSALNLANSILYMSQSNFFTFL
uniref:Uncharacterized protein n=1 Tax=Babesia bovis TaxID=5865 RepID=S6BGL4_BABBO|nr:hypothetical protein [Babesia bovis]